MVYCYQMAATVWFAGGASWVYMATGDDRRSWTWWEASKTKDNFIHKLLLGTPWIHVKLLLGAGIVLFGLPFVFSPNGSLLSKLLPKHVQGTIMCCSWLHLYFKTNCRIWSRSTTVCWLNCSHPGTSVGWCFTTPLLCSSRSTSWHSDWTHSKLPVGLYSNTLT